MEFQKRRRVRTREVALQLPVLAAPSEHGSSVSSTGKLTIVCHSSSGTLTAPLVL